MTVAPLHVAPKMAGRGYRLVSADSHIIEPADLWMSRLPRKFLSVAPHTERFEEGDAWVLDGVEEVLTFGFNASAGMHPSQARPWRRWEEIDTAGFEPAARIVAQDLDGVDAEVLYPSPRLFQYMANVADPEFHIALVHAYNEWLSEFCSYAPDRLGGLALMTNRGSRQACHELAAAMELPGIVGATMMRYPNGTLKPTADDDVVWEFAEAARIPLSIHIMLSDVLPVEHRTKAVPAAFRLWDAPDRIDQLIFSGILDRFPRLQLVFAEVDCGWLPYFKEQLNNGFRKLGGFAKFSVARPPSEYIDENMSFTFITDSFALHSRNAIGVDRMMWSSDYPHNASDWPYSWRTVSAACSDVPSEDRAKILADNALRLYNFADATAAAASSPSHTKATAE
jgi:predicted TIM-barrel fold metal-dependent hydrolase